MGAPERPASYLRSHMARGHKTGSFMPGFFPQALLTSYSTTAQLPRAYAKIKSTCLPLLGLSLASSETIFKEALWGLLPEAGQKLSVSEHLA